ncbi:hypothetical protein BVD23_02895 [Salmonella enterica]|nr:hypothetical protein [Salmonella enterica]EBI7617294.1 hypothetical protein [Salmonella enterica]EBI8100198.1 hypothetical protein [Salmonella enterica]EBK3003791.1 hypothetical protein [Salmonella enterica]EBK9152033.1 hypothetical protein [Salmonella enterica]
MAFFGQVSRGLTRLFCGYTKSFRTHRDGRRIRSRRTWAAYDRGDDAQSSAKRTEELVYKGFSIPEYR